MRRFQPVQPGGGSRVYVRAMRRPSRGSSLSSSSRWSTSSAERAETSACAWTVAARLAQ